MSNTCRSCSARVRWVRTKAGKPMPLDPEPNEAGNVTLDEAGVATVHSPQSDAEGVRYMPHFATCPNYRRRR